MRLEVVKIKRLRSIENCELINCGGFNVLIGKNNSGKSNILSAVNGFFSCIEEGNIVTLSSPFGQEIDFFEKNVQHPIEVTLIFSLLLAERDELMRDVVTEAPQMKNAIDGLDPSLRLMITIQVTPPSDGFGFVRKIALGNTAKLSGKTAPPEKLLFDMSVEAAAELFKQRLEIQHRDENIDFLRKTLSEIQRYGRRYFDEIQSETRERELPPLRYIFEMSARKARRIDDSFLLKIEEILRNSTNYEDFSRDIQTLMTGVKDEATKLQKESLRNKVVTFAGEQTAIPTYVSNLLKRVAAMKVLYLQERRKQIGREEAAKLLSLKVTRGGPEVLKNIQETVSALLGVQIDAFESELSVRRRESNAEMDIDNFLAEVNGSGVREALRIVLDYEFEHPNILLIEEPEIYLHPSLETSMMRYLKRISSDCQVFISTHSTNFLDTGEMKNVYLVSKPQSTKVQLLDYQEAETNIPQELGIRLSSLFMFDRLVFVEGSSDEAILREWASKLNINFSRENVGFIHMGGVRNFTHFAAEATLSFLKKRQVQMWFIIDRDEKDDNEINKLKQFAGDNATVKVISKREIENYLIHPRAISEFINLKNDLAGHSPDASIPLPEDVKSTLDKCVEDLKQIAIDKRVAKRICRPIYPNLNALFKDERESTITDRTINEIEELINGLKDRRDNAQNVCDEETKYIQNAWEAHKFDIVPGDVLLDKVCQEYGYRFKKEQDGPRLATLMNETEISSEFQTIIREIGTERVFN